MKRWTPGPEEALLYFWEEGKPASEIALALGVSRSAVLGKVMRLRRAGLPLATRPPTQKLADEREFKKKAAADRAKKVKIRKEVAMYNDAAVALSKIARKPPARLPKAVVTLMNAFPEQDGPKSGISFWRLGPSTCRYPLWGDRKIAVKDMRFCGAATLPGESWCMACFARVTSRQTDTFKEAAE